MKVAIDLDDTLTKYPHQICALARALKNSGHDVFVLTACAGELPPQDRPAEARRRVDNIGLRDIHVVWCDSSAKPKYCKDHSVNMIIDDRRMNLPSGICQLMPI